MSNETKRDVLKRALDFLVATGLVRNMNYDLERNQYISEYDAALPDDLPVIPKTVGDAIRSMRSYGRDLAFAIDTIHDRFRFARDRGGNDKVADWILTYSDTFALAWVLGVWRLEETGEIVKLEAKD